MAQGHESRRMNEEPSMAAPDFSCTLADQTVMEGLHVVLSCCGKGDPQPNMTWHHQGHEVVSNRTRTFMQDGEKLSLVLQSALLSDQGCYQCVLCNCAGKASCQGHLQVIAAVPIPIEDAPLVKKVTCEAIVLSWKPPKIFMALTAGITYAVQYQADGQGPWIVLASRVVETSYTAPSLSPGSHYRFRILLVTPQGCSSPSPPSAPCLLPGDREAVIEDLLHKERRITDEYIIKEEIGWGSFGVVHCVSNIVTSTDYAAKLIPASRGHREDALRELRILKSLRHPHVIQLHDMFYGHRSIIALLELCSNEELLERIVKQATLSELQVQMYMKQLLEGISYLHHHNILHLDIEPSNILLAHPLKDNIRICDFGFAQELSPEGPQYSRFGSPEFIAPEIVLQMPVCKATDIWPVGVITYICLCGLSLFLGASPKATLHNVTSRPVSFMNVTQAISKPAQDFIGQILISDSRKRPQAEECLKHFWFEAPATTSCATDRINFFLSRRKLQRSLVRYKSGVVLKSVAQILADPVGHSALKVARPSRKLRVHYPLAVSSESEDSEFDERCIMPSFSEPNEHVNEGNERDAFDPYLKPLPELKQPINTAFNLQDPKLHVPKSSSGIKTPLEVCKNSNKDIENMKLFSLETLKINDRQSDLEKLASPCLTTVPLTTIGNISGCNYNKDQKSVLKNRKCTNIPPISYSKFSSDCGHRHEKHRNALSRVIANAKGQLEDQDGEPRQLTCCSEDLDVLKSHIEQSTQKSNCSSNDESMLQSTKYMPSSTHCAENTHTQQDKKRALMSFEHFDDQSQLNIVGTTVGPNPLVVESQQSAGHGISSNQFKLAPIKSERSLTKRVMQNLFSRALKSPRLRVRCSSQGQTMPSVQNLEGTDDATQNKSTTSEFIPVDFLDENSSGVKKPFKKSLCYLKSRQLKQSEMASLSKDSCIPSSPKVGIPVTLHENQEPESFDSDPNEDTDWTLRDMECTNYITKADSMDIISLGAKQDKAVQSVKSNNLKTQKSLAGELKYKDNSMDVHADDYNFDVVSAGKDNEVKMGTTLQNKELDQVDSVRNWRNEKNAISCQVPATPCTKCGTEKLESIDSLQNLADVGKDTMEKSKLKGFRHGKRTEGEWWVPPRSPGAVLRQKLGAAMSGFSLRRHQTENWRKDTQRETSPVEMKNSLTGLPINFTTLNLHTQPLLKPPPSPSAWSYHSTRSDGTNSNSQGGQPHLGDWNVNHFSSKNQPSANSSTRMHQKVANEVTSPTRRRKTLTYTLKSLATSRKRQGFPPSFQLPLRDLDPVEGSSVTLCCLPTGSDPLSISWLKDNKVLSGIERLHFARVADGRQLLSIMGMQKEDVGLYKCVAENMNGVAHTTCNLTLAEPPKEMKSPDVPQVFGHSALVVWKASEARLPISHTLEKRTVLPWKESACCWEVVASKITDTYYHVRNLQPGHSYQVRVACANKAGLGPFSSPSITFHLSGRVPHQ